MNLESDNFNEEESDKCVSDFDNDEFTQIIVDCLTEDQYVEAEKRLEEANENFVAHLHQFRTSVEMEPYGAKAIKLKKVVESMYKALLTCRTSKHREEYNGQGYIKTEQDYNKALVEEAIKQYEGLK